MVENEHEYEEKCAVFGIGITASIQVNPHTRFVGGSVKESEVLNIAGYYQYYQYVET